MLFKKVLFFLKKKMEMFCQFKILPYLCTRFRQSMRRRDDRAVSTIDP